MCFGLSEVGRAGLGESGMCGGYDFRGPNCGLQRCDAWSRLPLVVRLVLGWESSIAEDLQLFVLRP